MSSGSGDDGVDSHSGGSGFGRTHPLQLGGHCVIEPFWVAQSTSRLWSVSQEGSLRVVSKVEGDVDFPSHWVCLRQRDLV